MDLLESKETILNEVNKLFENYSVNVSTMCQQITHISQELSMVHQMNHKLMKEIDEKDKLLLLNEKKCYDYEVMINKIQEDANKEVDVKTRHDMLRAQDKEIFNRDEEIKRLQKKVNEQGKTIKQNNETELPSKSGGKLVEKMKEITQKQTVKEEIENPVVTEVVEDVEVVEVDKSGKKEVEEVVVEVEEVVEVEDVEVEDVEVDKENDKSGETTEELSEEEEEITVTTITHYTKDYYIIDGEEPQYIYAIEDGELGDKKGEMRKGKKHMYKK
jgi:hypothetical protein